MPRLKVVLIKPSKYGIDGYVERFRWGFMPNATLPYMKSLTPTKVDGWDVEVFAIDEYVQTDLSYLSHLAPSSDSTLLALVGVQSHQLHRSLDLAAYALANGVRHCVIGGPHPMTCDTTTTQNCGVSFSVSEAEITWDEILRDAIQGSLKPVYSGGSRWQIELDSPVVTPPARDEFRRYFVPMLGLYPARGCPFTCNFCSVIKIAGRHIRSGPIDRVIESLRLAKASGIRVVMFTSDNFNKYSEADTLLRAMIDEKLDLRFLVQCDTQIVRQDGLLELLGRAGCHQMFVGVESFSRKALLGARKAQNQPSTYGQIVEKCRANGILSHFSNIVGFPQDSQETINEHLEILSELSPDAASFYVLTPIPGTEQYREFRNEGLLVETNLDRYDTTFPTWKHPHLSPLELERAQYMSYHRFYSAREIARRLWRHKGQREFFVAAYPFFSRYSAYTRHHPMSGGVRRRRVDRASDYLDLRRERYGFQLAPLPDNLELSEADYAFNMGASLESPVLRNDVVLQ